MLLSEAECPWIVVLIYYSKNMILFDVAAESSCYALGRASNILFISSLTAMSFDNQVKMVGIFFLVRRLVLLIKA